MFKLMGKEINAISGAQTILNWTYDTSNLSNSAGPNQFRVKDGHRENFK